MAYATFDVKLTDRQKELIQTCQQIKEGDRMLQRSVEKKGLRQFTKEEIDIVNTLRSVEISNASFPIMPIETDSWIHIPLQEYSHLVLHPATINVVRHIQGSYYLISVTLDETNRHLTWVAKTDVEEGLIALFDASPFLKEEV